jgi:hypothetical protein
MLMMYPKIMIKPSRECRARVRYIAKVNDHKGLEYVQIGSIGKMLVSLNNHGNLEEDVYSAGDHAYHITHVYLCCAQDKSERIDPYYDEIDQHGGLTA